MPTVKMSDDPVALITISSSDNEDVQEVQVPPAGSSKNMESNSNGGNTKKRKVPLQRVPAGKEIFSEFVEKYKSTTKDDLAEIEKISKKLWKRFNEASEDYTKSKSFQELMSKAMEKFDSMPYSQLKAVSDELRNHKKTQIAPTSNNCLPAASSATSQDGHDPEMDPKTLLHIQKLEKVLAKLHHHIQKLENNEVDLNSSDEENSAYIQVARYKERFCKVFKKVCELKKKDPHAERAYKKHIKFSGTQIPEVNRAIEKFYNAQREFPDYRDILTVVKKANAVKQLKLSSVDINLTAQKAFQELGKTLKKYRQYDDVEIFRSYLSNEEDPASKDVELEKTLEENKKKYGNRIDEVIDKYAIIQDNERLEPTEVLSNAEDEEDDEDDEDLESDNGSRSSMLESKSDLEESADEADRKCYPDCRVILTDVRFSPAWEQYVVRKEEAQSMDVETNSNEHPVVVIENSSSQSNRKRSLESESEECDSTDDEDYYKEPIPSTSKQIVPITLSNYRHIKRSKTEKADKSVQDEDSNEKSANISSMDTDEFKVDDSASTEQKKIVDVNNSKNSEGSSSSSSSPRVMVLNNSSKNLESSSSSISSPGYVVINNSELEKSTDLESSSVDDIIDVDKDDLPKKTSIDSKDKTSNSEQQESLKVDLVPNHFLCPNDTLPLEVVLDVDEPTTSKPVAETNQSKTAKNKHNDEIVIIDENIKPKTPTKVNDDIIDVEEISDSPDKPQQLVKKSLGQPVNLSQIIRSMNFGSGSGTTGKNRMTANSSRQVTTTRTTNINQLQHVNKMKNPFQNFRQNPPNTTQTMSRTMNNFPNTAQSRSVNQFMNQRQHSNSNNRQFASTMQRNMQNLQFFANNSNNSMKSSQAAMQRKHVSERTVQMYDSKTNKMVTRREITTVVQQSVTQFVGQNQRVVNRQVQQVRRQQVSTKRNGSSDDIITLD